jgi:preprotein translocase subunit SecF
MELFKNTNYDFLGWKWPFIVASLVLSVAGLTSLALKGGPRYGIDFKGGMVMTVKFAGKPPIEEIRTSVKKVVTGEVSVQTFETSSNEVAIGTELADARQLDQNRSLVLQTLQTMFGHPVSGKLDFNSASHEALENQLRDALARNNVAMSDADLQKLVKDLLDFRDTPPRSGLLTSFDQLSALPGLKPGVINALKQECYPGPFAVRRVEVVGPQVGADLRHRAIWATLAALGGMLVYIAFRFEWIYGVAAVVACFHDTIITIGFFSLFNKEITMTVIAALLTLVGYSMNDTIVIFDRIRENLKLSRREPLEQVINRSVNQTLSRTVMTSGLTFLTVMALFLFGGDVLHGFSFALVVGILIGTYSSVFVASPIVLFWHNWFDARQRAAVVATPAKLGPAKQAVRNKSSVKAVK